MEEDLQCAVEGRGLWVSTASEKGRSLITTRDFSPGDVILSQEPYVSVPNVPRCEGCFSSTNIKKCSACQVVWYCGSACQKSDWKSHRLECQALSKLDKERKSSLTPSLRLMVKLCIRRKLQAEKVLPTTPLDNYALVEALVSHMSKIDENQLLLYAQMASLVHFIVQWDEISIKEIAENFSKFACNAHSICDSELQPLGTGLYTVISIINHSCLPNSVLVFEGSIAVVRALQYIPKGNEVLISYIETAGSTMSRQKALKEQYFFTCSCPRCTKLSQYDDIQESAFLEGYRCRDSSCSGFLLCDPSDRAFVCQQCGLIRNREEIGKIASKVQLLMDRVSPPLSYSNYWEAYTLYKGIEKLQMELFHSLSLSLMRTREALLKILMELKDWAEALSYCRLTIPIYQRVYPGFHPLLGLQYYTLGKLEWLLGHTEDAVQSLASAMDILRITHGTKTQFIKDLMMKLEEARAEASHKLSNNDR